MKIEQKLPEFKPIVRETTHAALTFWDPILAAKIQNTAQEILRKELSDWFKTGKTQGEHTMKQTVELPDFIDAFIIMGREDNFSREGLEVLFEYLREEEGAQCEEMELDVIAFCCEFREQSVTEIAAEYEFDAMDPHEDGFQQYVQDELSYLTSVVGVTSEGTIVYAVF